MRLKGLMRLLRTMLFLELEIDEVDVLLVFKIDEVDVLLCS